MEDGAGCPDVIDDAAAGAEAAVATEEAAGAPVAAGPARGLVEDQQAVGDVHACPAP